MENSVSEKSSGGAPFQVQTGKQQIADNSPRAAPAVEQEHRAKGDRILETPQALKSPK
jgi:hypothetical protein|tara:strand:- start:735 stop:908 length:174 start_codon:yes stop_codon:yes gene_type:complete